MFRIKNENNQTIVFNLMKSLRLTYLNKKEGNGQPNPSSLILFSITRQG